MEVLLKYKANHYVEKKINFYLGVIKYDANSIDDDSNDNKS